MLTFPLFLTINSAQKLSLKLRICSVNVSESVENCGDLVTFTKEILNGKIHFLCSEENFRLSQSDNFTFPIASSNFSSNVILTLNVPIPDKVKKAFIKPFEAPQRKVKIKI